MSVITNFKKRQQFKAQKEQASVKEKLAPQPQVKIAKKQP